VLFLVLGLAPTLVSHCCDTLSLTDALPILRDHRFGPPEVILVEDAAEPEAASGEVVVQVKAAGVGPWDALIRSGRSALPQPLPLTLGADFSGIVHAVGPGIENVALGDEVFGATNQAFTGACAEYAVAKAGLIAHKPKTLNHAHAASVPVVAVTAWQMVFELARLSPRQTVLIHGGAGNVGGYLVQLAKRAGALVIATVSARDASYTRSLGADGVIDRAAPFEEKIRDVDTVLDTVGGETLDRSFAVLKRHGTLVSSAAPPASEKAQERGVRALFFLVQVTTERLRKIAGLIDAGELKTQVGEVLWLHEARKAHEMLAGAPHRRGKIVIKIAD
jgi:NADPH:quinone reductase-like Zn-dependent oxidoreductase